jgi:hypothetical protein
MKLLKGIGTGLSLAALCLFVAPKATADDSNQKTSVTLTDPIEVPGVGQHLLPPGTYVFRLKNSSADRHVVEIFNQDETQALTTLLSIPNDRLNATNKPVLTFSARPAGQPEALKAWFHSGEHSGEQFVWERTRAIELAKQANEAVLSTPVVMVSATVDTLNSARLEAVNPNGETIDTAQVVEAPPDEVVAIDNAPAVDRVASIPRSPVQEAAVAPAPSVVDPVASNPAPVVASAAVAPPPVPDVAVAPAPPVVDPVASAPAPSAAPDTVAPPPVQEAAVTPAPAVVPEPVVSPSLPQTASQLPLIGLAGLLCLGVGFGLLILAKPKA